MPPSSSSSCGEGMYGSPVEPALLQRNHGANSRDVPRTRRDDATDPDPTTPPPMPRYPRRRLHLRQRARSKRRHTSRARKRALGGSHRAGSGSHRFKAPPGTRNFNRQPSSSRDRAQHASTAIAPATLPDDSRWSSTLTGSLPGKNPITPARPTVAAPGDGPSEPDHSLYEEGPGVKGVA